MASTGQDNTYALDDQSIQEPPKSLWVALTKIGPGIILAGSIIGSGELLLTTGLGAKYGFVFLWLILFSCVVKVFVQIELGRYAISSGQPTLAALDELPGPRLGTHWIWLVVAGDDAGQHFSARGDGRRRGPGAEPGVSAGRGLAGRSGSATFRRRWASESPARPRIRGRCSRRSRP